MEALYRAGEAEYALELLTLKSDRSWYNMIRVGSTITMEAWDMKYKRKADWNHAWGAVPANMVAEFDVSTASGEVLMLDGEKAPAAFETLRLTPGTHKIEVVVNSF